MKNHKSKEVLLAETAYAAGRKDAKENAIETDEKEIVRIGAACALQEWREITGGLRTAKPTDIQRARKKWEAESRPREGTIFGGAKYVFAPDGEFRLTETLFENANFNLKQRG